MSWGNGVANGRREPSSVGQWSGSTLGDDSADDVDADADHSDADIDLEAEIDKNKLEAVISGDMELERDKWERKVSFEYEVGAADV